MKITGFLGASLVAAALVCGPALAQPDDARRFLEDALKGDNSEMMLGRLAAEHGASAEVRAYGQTLHDDHARARDAAEPVARQVGVAITDKTTPEAMQERRKLEGLHGRAFDHEFAQYMVQDHKKDIAEFERQSRRGGPTADLAAKTLPDLRKHLAAAERLSHG